MNQSRVLVRDGKRDEEQLRRQARSRYEPPGFGTRFEGTELAPLQEGRF